MSKTVDELLIQVTLNAKQLQQSLGNAEQSINRFANKISGVMNTALDLIALKFSVSFGKNLIETFANTGAKLHFLSSQLGESVGTLDKWGMAVQKAGGNADSFYATINNLHNKLVDMKFNGDMQTASTFGMLGIKTTNADHSLRKTTDILLDLSDKLKGKDANFQQFIGRKLGIDESTIRVLSQGRDATLKLVNAQKQLYNEKTAAAAEKQREKLIDFERTLDKLKITIAEKLLPSANKFIDWIQKFVTQHGKDLAVIIENVVNGLIKMIEYLPNVTTFFSDLNKTLGLTVADLGKILAGLMALKVAKDIFAMLGAGATAFSSPLVAAVVALTSLYKIWEMMQEKANNPDEFNKGMTKTVNAKDSWLNKGLGWLSDKTGLNMTTGGNSAATSSMWDKVIDWAQGMAESGNKDSTIGYKMKKDASGKYQNVLDAKGNKIPEAYGRYQIKPSTASEVMGRNVTSQELLNGDFNKQVHDKYMAQLEAKHGSKEAALAAYNGDLSNYRKTGQSDYVNKIKGFMGGLNPASLANQQAIGQANQPKVAPQQGGQGTNITVNTMNVNADNPKQLASAVQSKINPVYAFANSPRIA